MKREDLFLAIGEVEEQRLIRCEQCLRPSCTELEENHMTKVKCFRKVWLIAAIIAAAALLMGSAVYALVSMQTGYVRSYAQDGTYREGEKVDFEEVHDVFIELGAYYPQEIPVGYTMTFVSEGAPYQNQTIHYENEAGDGIYYWIYIADPASDAEVYDITKKTNVRINGQDGILYEHGTRSRTLVWSDRKQGFGFKLNTDDPAVDLLAMAESTAEGEPLVPTRSEDTKEGIAQLGDFSPTYLPEGFEEQGVSASPLENGGGWYSYVRKWYVNKAENTRIYLEYESYVIDTESGYVDDAKTVCSFWIPGYERGVAVYEEVEVCRMFGLATQNHIVWADPETHRVFHLTSEDVIGDDLLKVAQSIVENP